MSSTAADDCPSTDKRSETSSLFRIVVSKIGGHFDRLVEPVLQLVRVYGLRQVVAIAIIYGAAKGTVLQAVQSGQLSLLKDRIGVNGETYQQLLLASGLAWALKPAAGLIGDSCALGGYKRRGWMMLCSSGCTVFVLLLGGIATLSGGSACGSICPAALLATLSLFGSLSCIAALDVFTEAAYSTLVRQAPRNGASLVSWAWMWCLVGGAVGSVLCGPLADADLSQWIFLAAIPFSLLSIVPPVMNWFLEQEHRDRVRPELGHSTTQNPEDAAILREGNEENAGQELDEAQLQRIRWLGWMIASATFVFAVVSALSLKTVLPFATFGVLVVVVAGSFVCLPPLIARANVFMFLKEALYIQVPGALDYFYTANADCVPNGPHFSYTFYQTSTTIVGYGAAMVGVAAFHWWMDRTRTTGPRTVRLSHVRDEAERNATSVSDPVLGARSEDRVLSGARRRVAAEEHNTTETLSDEAQTSYSNRAFRFVFGATTIVKIVASLFDIAIVSRLSVRLGIPDRLAYLLGDAMVFNACAMLDFMPAVLLTAQLCPPGLEATMYALLAGCSNLGSSVSKAIGSNLILAFGIRTQSLDTKSECNFDSLPALLFIGHCITPLGVLLLIKLLLPEALLSSSDVAHRRSESDMELSCVQRDDDA